MPYIKNSVHFIRGINIDLDYIYPRLISFGGLAVFVEITPCGRKKVFPFLSVYSRCGTSVDAFYIGLLPSRFDLNE